ncbi:hypothetical protein C8F01DRAFT_1080231 [Mycena amicta]|nr:hypothetical protein C8F01DRAFT_1080231 [Mycena amicta]
MTDPGRTSHWSLRQSYMLVKHENNVAERDKDLAAIQHHARAMKIFLERIHASDIDLDTDKIPATLSGNMKRYLPKDAGPNLKKRTGGEVIRTQVAGLGVTRVFPANPAKPAMSFSDALKTVNDHNVLSGHFGRLGPIRRIISKMVQDRFEDSKHGGSLSRDNDIWPPVGIHAGRHEPCREKTGQQIPPTTVIRKKGILVMTLKDKAQNYGRIHPQEPGRLGESELAPPRKQGGRKTGGRRN